MNGFVDGFVGTAEAARVLGLKRARVLELIHEGTLPAVRCGVKVWRIDRRDVDALAKARAS